MSNDWSQDFNKRTQATLQWLEKSIQTTDYQGSSAYYHLIKGWSLTYPETTGYIIETLFDYAKYLQQERWKNLAITCADWLCSIQRPDGAFPGGINTNADPIVFDTGQILFGLVRAFKETGDLKYKLTTERAVVWLINILELDGSWQRYSYVPNYIPAYYTRVIWAILYANEILKKDEIIAGMQLALNYYLQNITPQLSFKNWSFKPNESAYTHTIAYTLRGILESGILLNDERILTKATAVIDKLITIYKDKEKLAGKYDENWNGDYTFECVTGNAQMSIVLTRLFQLTGNVIYQEIALHIFQATFSRQWLIPLQGLYGAIPGSHPLWGAYQRFKFPNWAAKFYLDAYLLLYKVTSE
ncbi:MAG: hypothetical protein SFU99_17485 [Saprospiraceae bacterium]|nr:hypothetical protein [Saprospiraceae bacterium]